MIIPITDLKRLKVNAMKKLSLVLFAAIGLAFCASCEKEPKEQPFPVGTWHTTHQYFDLTVDEVLPETLKDEIEQEIEQKKSVAVAEAESYRLTFNEDGTGIFQSWMSADGYRPTHRFSWMMSEEGQILMDFTIIDPPTRTTFTATDIWDVERFTADELVVRTTDHAHTYLGIKAEVDIEYRYTLRRME